jgi:hypothetical protein
VAAPLVRCTSCGSEAADTVAVRRVYVTPEAWDAEERVEVVDEIEQWCFPCRTHYPHQPVEAEADGSGPGAVDEPA